MTRLAIGRSPDVDPLIAGVAGGQHGVATRAQLLALGVTPKAIDHRLAAGRLIAVHRCVYAVGHAGPSDLGRIQAALLTAGPRAAASHGTAGYLDHLTSTLPAVIHVTTLAPARRSRRGLIIHATTRPFATKTVDGLPITTTLRTLEDLRWPDRLVREALANRLVVPEELPDAGDLAPTQSELERRMRRLCARAGLPPPVCQYPIGPYRVDFAWPEQRVLVETDGFMIHGRRRSRCTRRPPSRPEEEEGRDGGRRGKDLPGDASEPVGDGPRELANDRNGVEVRPGGAPSGPGVRRGGEGAEEHRYRRGRRPASRCWFMAFAWVMWRREFI